MSYWSASLRTVRFRTSGPFRFQITCSVLWCIPQFNCDQLSGWHHFRSTTVFPSNSTETIRDVVNPDAEIVWDSSKPDGTPRKLLDTSRLNDLGWSPSIGLRDGLASTYAWFLEHVDADDIRGVGELVDQG